MLVAGCGSTVQQAETTRTVQQEGLTGFGSADTSGNSPSAETSGGPLGSPGVAPIAAAPNGAGVSVGAGDGTTTPPTSAQLAALPPIVIGTKGVDNTQATAAAAGVRSDPNYIDGATTMAALARHFRQHGIAGRRVKVVASVSAQNSPDYNVAAQETCAKFTQDNKVDVVLSNTGFFTENLAACLERAGVPSIEGNFGATDDYNHRQYPSFFSSNMPSQDLRFRMLATGGAEAGLLKPGTHLGVLVEDCPWNQRPYESVFLPAAKQAGVVIDAFHVNCFEGFGDLGALASQLQSAVLRFATNRDTAVVMLSTPVIESVQLWLFMQSASKGQYYPSYVVDSAGQPQSGYMSGNYPKEHAVNMHGVFGWLPETDVNDLSVVRPAQKRCLSIMRAQGLSPQTAGDFTNVYAACDSFFLLEAALQGMTGPFTAQGLRSRIEAFGTGFVPTGMLGEARFGPRRHSGTFTFRTMSFVGSCGCFRYSSGIRRAA